VAALAERIDVLAGINDTGYSFASFTAEFVSTQVSPLQIDADVGRGEADQRR
jgi:hypothetical protein